ncbi:hypothetical protein [Pedobacter arcticus]|uniref:hypothetical protein n=1 Tax=Pedobacter arcticus TaxID=752140 RepID=UPI0002F8B8B2|nr:hypothetical protein [Pedobacter arcticus]
MIYRIIAATFLWLLSTQLVDAQSQLIPIYNSKNLVNNTLKIKSDSGSLNITAYSANVIKLTFSDVKTDSNIVSSSGSPLNIRVTQNLDDIFFATDSLWVIVSKYDLSVRFLKKKNEELLVKNSSFFLANQSHNIGFSLSADDTPNLFEGNKIRSVKLNKDKPFIGKKKMCNPLLISPKGYALFVKSASKEKTKISTAVNHQIKFELDSSLNTFYFLSGNTDEIKRNLDLIKVQLP